MMFMKKAFLKTLIFCSLFFCLFQSELISVEAAYIYDIDNGIIEIEESITVPGTIDVSQNGTIIDSAINSTEVIEIISSSQAMTSNHIYIDVTGISTLTVQIRDVHIDTTSIHTGAIDVRGTGDLRIQLEGTNEFKSDDRIVSESANGLSSKLSNGVNITLAGSGTSTFTGYDCGIYVKQGTLTIESGIIQAISTYPTPETTAFGNGIYVLSGALTITGGEIYAQGAANGIYVDRTVTITGGVVNAVGTQNRGIHAASNLEITGGYLTTTGKQMGIQVNSTSPSFFRISGGTIIAEATNTAQDWNYLGTNAEVTGGSIQGEFPTSFQPKNKNGDFVYLTALTLESGVKSEITSCVIDSVACVTSDATGIQYGINDVVSDSNGVVYFYLSEATEQQVTIFDQNSIRYQNRFNRDSSDTITATLYKDKEITFHYLDINGNQSSVYSVGYGDTFTGVYPSGELPMGYTFRDWYTSSTGTELFNFSLPITVNQQAYAQYDIVLPPTMELPIPTLPVGVVGESYYFTMPEAIGGYSTINYVVVNLPEGLSFNPSTREITGIPVAEGIIVITYQATDSYVPAQIKTIEARLEIIANSEGGNIPENPGVSTIPETAVKGNLYQYIFIGAALFLAYLKLRDYSKVVK